MVVGLIALATFAQAVASEPVCLYYMDPQDGRIWRTTLKGTHTELVIDEPLIRAGKLAETIRFAPTYPTPQARGALHLSHAPVGEGFLVIDAAADGVRRLTKPIPGGPSYLDLQVRTLWEVIPERNLKSYGSLTKLEMKAAGKTRRFDFSKPSTRNRLLGVLSSEYAVLQDGEEVTLWHLPTNAKSKVVDAADSVLWIRDLESPERFKPSAKVTLRSKLNGLAAGIYEWTLSDPADVYVKPDYLKRRL